jgi:hypothetical protein
MINLANLPDLSEVKDQVDRIDANVANIAEQVADIHAVFEGLKTMLPGIMPAGPSDGDVFSITGLHFD